MSRKRISKGQGIYNLKKVLRSRGIAADLIDLEAFYDSTLTYSENKDNILDQLGLKVSDDEREFLYQQIDVITDQRSEAAQRADDAKRARRTYKPTNIRGIREWIRHPHRVDLEGVDCFNTSKKPKRRKRKR